MSLYDGTGNDINIAGFKTTNIALKNTPQQNPKEFKTKTEKQAKENDGKTSSIINLIDEIDTTLYVINDKLDETPEIMLGKGGLSGGVLTKEGLGSMKLPEIKEELKKRGIKFKQGDKKTNLLERLEVFILNPDRVKEYKPEAVKREIETQTEQRYTYGPPLSIPPPPSSSVYVRKYNKDRYQEEDDDEDFSKFLPMPPSGPPVAQPQTYGPLPPIPPPSDVLLRTSSEDRYQDKKEKYYRARQAAEDYERYKEGEKAGEDARDDGSDDYDGGDDYNPAQNRRPTPSSRNDLNSNIMKLEEQVDRLSKLTKGINSFINFSNPVEVEKLNNSSKKIVDSSNGLKEHLNDITPINKIFETKMNSIINKIELENTKITSALNGYTYTFMEGGNIHNNHILDFMNSSKKRFY
jgi:hypothetical protein